MGNIEESWRNLEATVDDLGKTLKQALATASKALTNARGGSAPKARVAVDSIAEELARATEALSSAESLLADLEGALASTDNLVNELDITLREAHPDRRVLKNRDELAVFPVFVKVGAAKIRVDKETIPTQRPSIVAAAVGRSLQETDLSEAFLKALRGAFRLATGDQLTGVLPLETIYRVLATTSPGLGSYSRHDFKIDLQRLLLSGLRTVDGVNLELKVAAAGPDAISVYAPSGDLLNVAYAVFTKAETNDE